LKIGEEPEELKEGNGEGVRVFSLISVEVYMEWNYLI
jgi:hypothetical protein